MFLIIDKLNSQAVRKYSNEFMKIGVGGKYLGLGGSLAAGSEDVAAVFYNPASLANLENVHVSGMHTSYFAGIANFDYAGVAIPLKNNQTLGVSLLRYGIDNIPNTIELYNPDNTINYDNIRSFSIADYALVLTFAKKIEKIDGLSIGTNAKIIHRSYGSFASAWGFGLDAAAQISRDKYSIGFFAQDISTTFNSWSFSFTDREKEVFKATANEIPENSLEITSPSFHFGGNYNFFLSNENIRISPSLKLIGFTDKRNVLLPIGPISIDLALGTEVGFFNTAFLRLGISNFTKALNPLGEEYLSMQPSVGVGLKISNLRLDYSYLNIANTGIGLYSHVISASYFFDK